MAGKAPSKSAKAGEKKANRKPNGQFGPGNNYGAAPYSKQKKEWRDQVEAAFREVVPIERLKKQIEAVAKQADRGNQDALKFELDYSYGKPPQDINLGGDAAFEIVISERKAKN